METILLVDDDLTFAKIIAQFLKRSGYRVDVCHNVKAAAAKLHAGTYSLLLLDYRLPDGTGLDLMHIAHQNGLNAPTIIMTSFNDVRTAVSAMQSGALNYITKPVNREELLMLVSDAIHSKGKTTSPDALQTLPAFVEGISPAANKMHQQVGLVAPTDMSVIIYGESGTGKEYVARQIHQRSKRVAKPFVAVDCGTLSSELASSELFGHVKGAFTGALHNKQGRFEEAAGGTLFLDEISNLDYDVQVKLLRAIQESVIYPVGSNKEVKFDIRILVATNEDLRAGANRGRFREDLYHRLNEFRINVPALRHRLDDLPLFVDYFIRQSNQALHRDVHRVSPGTMEVFRKYDWPGNIRELRNIIKRLVLLSTGTIAGEEGLPEDMIPDPESPDTDTGTDMKLAREKREKELIEKTLKEANYNKLQAARLLNINRSTLYAKMEKYAIKRK